MKGWTNLDGRWKWRWGEMTRNAGFWCYVQETQRQQVHWLWCYKYVFLAILSVRTMVWKLFRTRKKIYLGPAFRILHSLQMTSFFVSLPHKKNQFDTYLRWNLNGIASWHKLLLGKMLISPKYLFVASTISVIEMWPTAGFDAATKSESNMPKIINIML